MPPASASWLSLCHLGCACAWHVCGGTWSWGRGGAWGEGEATVDRGGFVPEAAWRVGLGPDKEPSVCRGCALSCCHSGLPGGAGGLSPVSSPGSPLPRTVESQIPAAAGLAKGPVGGLPLSSSCHWPAWACGHSYPLGLLPTLLLLEWSLLSLPCISLTLSS